MLPAAQEYMRQLLLEGILRDSEQAALREQAAAALAATPSLLGSHMHGSAPMHGGHPHAPFFQAPPGGTLAAIQRHHRQQVPHLFLMSTFCSNRGVPERQAHDFTAVF